MPQATVPGGAAIAYPSTPSPVTRTSIPAGDFVGYSDELVAAFATADDVDLLRYIGCQTAEIGRLRAALHAIHALHGRFEAIFQSAQSLSSYEVLGGSPDMRA
jgi:hypothetical protein